jgi:hypothetical protein
MSANIGKGAYLLLSITQYDDRLITDGGCYILTYFGNFTLVANANPPINKDYVFFKFKEPLI